MKKNDTFILKIEDMGIGGEGIGKYEGMTTFCQRCSYWRRDSCGRD